MFARIVLILSLLVLIIGGTVWYRGAREYRPSPVSLSERSDQVTLSRNFPGGSPPVMPSTRTNYEESGYAVSEGSHFYQTFNCNGCHQNGGGGIGPALMDDKWIYGSEPRNIFATIVEGRPNGMPSFRGKIPDAQIWQIVAYVRSMSGLVPAAVRSAREDAMQTHPPTTLQSPETPHPGGNVPPSAERTQ